MDAEHLRQQLLATFRVEAGEHRQALDECFVALEQDPVDERRRELEETAFRVMHTLKGAARSVGLEEVESVCQAAEMVLSRAARGGPELSGHDVALLRAAVTTVTALLAGEAPADGGADVIGRLEARAAGAGPNGSPEPATPRVPAIELGPGTTTIRLDPRKLDTVLARAEHLLEAKLLVDARAQEAWEIAHRLARARGPSARDEAAAAARALAERLGGDAHVLAAAVDRLLEAARGVRLMPASTVLDLFPGMVHDLARAAGKEVQWHAGGGELELDRLVLQRIKDPLVHLVRNAVDHGIELPAERAAKGKPGHGRVAVEIAARADGRIAITVQDDGRGFDPDRLRAAATRMGAVSPGDARDLGDDEAVDLAFHPGLSTSPTITDVSGHGLGLAIVRQEIERLDARIRVDTSRAGTRVCMVVPASIATFRGLLVRAGAQQLLLPSESVQHVLRPQDGDLGRVEGREALRWRDHVLAVAALDSLLGIERPEDLPHGDQPAVACVLAGTEDVRAALLVDEVLGHREVLVKELEPPLVRIRHVAGVGVLGGGEPVLILRAGDLVRGARRSAPAPSRPGRTTGTAGQPTSRVLVVDDAVTTRAMERSLLEAAGYDVEVAVDGADAWATLAERDFDLLVSDVDMPAMDGFELTARVRADPRLSHLPVVLVTALESRDDRYRGIEVGASAYLVKSSFDQSHLLDVIRRLGVLPSGEAAT